MGGVNEGYVNKTLLYYGGLLNWGGLFYRAPNIVDCADDMTIKTRYRKNLEDTGYNKKFSKGDSVQNIVNK